MMDNFTAPKFGIFEVNADFQFSSNGERTSQPMRWFEVREFKKDGTTAPRSSHLTWGDAERSIDALYLADSFAAAGC